MNHETGPLENQDAQRKMRSREKRIEKYRLMAFKDVLSTGPGREVLAG